MAEHSNIAKAPRGPDEDWARLAGTAGAADASQPQWLRDRRAAAETRFRAAGLPTPKREDFKFTNLAPLRRTGFRAPTRFALDAALLPEPIEAAARLVFVNGRFAPALSRRDGLPAGLRLMSLREAADEEPALLEAQADRLLRDADMPLADLNAALAGDGLVIMLSEGAQAERPIVITHVSLPEAEPIAYHPRHLLVAEPGSRVTLLEQHIGAGEGVYFANHLTEMLIGREAQVQHYRLQEETKTAFHHAGQLIRLSEGAAYDALQLSLGGALARNETRVALAGRHARCRLLGAYAGNERQHLDHTLVVNHEAPETESRQVYKGVLDGRARGVFQGRIAVSPDAQKIDGHQLSRALLLSEAAEINAKPELEILADDVRCSHGATAGELDEDALFYLRSRGLPETEARQLLVEGFLDEVVDEAAETPIRMLFRERVARWLGAQGEEPRDG